jgi:hypothetical protein
MNLYIIKLNEKAWLAILNLKPLRRFSSFTGKITRLAEFIRSLTDKTL